MEEDITFPEIETLVYYTWSSKSTMHVDDYFQFRRYHTLGRQNCNVIFPMLYHFNIFNIFNSLAIVGAYRRLEILRLWYWERL